MRFERLGKIFEDLVGTHNLGIIFYDVSGNEIAGYAHRDGEKDTRGLIIIPDKDDITLFFPRNPLAFLKPSSIKNISLQDGTYQVIIYEYISHIKCDFWGLNEFTWHKIQRDGKIAYYTKQKVNTK